MERSANFNFYLPSRDSADIADINQISYNFMVVDENVPKKNEVVSLLGDGSATLKTTGTTPNSITTKQYVDSEIQSSVDVNYSPTSARAQSGIAVAEATAQKPFKLIEKITLEEDATVSRSQTPVGEDYNFNEMKIVIKFTNLTSNINLYCGIFADKYQPASAIGNLYLPNAGLKGSPGYATYTAKISPYNNGTQDNNYIADFYASSSSPGASPVYSCGLFSQYQEGSIPSLFENYTGKFKRFKLGQMPAGTIIYIIAR